ncbi:MAG: hypothetical protein ACJ780_31245 [Solirubrobacteraceae bacterium]
MFIILVYAPFLLCLPVLLLAGVVFVVVPGGFIVVLGGLYYAAMWFGGLLWFAANRRWRARSSRVRRANTTIENTSPSGRASFGPRRATAPSPGAVRLTNDRAAGAAPSLVLGRTLSAAAARKDSFAHPPSSDSESRA